MRTAFVATVGIGTGPEADITRPLVKSIHESNPDYLLLLATGDSEDNARRVCAELGRTPDDSRVHILQAGKEDVERVFKEMLDAVHGLLQAGYSPGDVTADFTTGTKPMSAALVSVASLLGLGRLKYVSVERSRDRTVCPGTERTVTFLPTRFAASAALVQARAYLRTYRFAVAEEILAGVPDYLLSESETATRDCLLGLARLLVLGYVPASALQR